MSSVHMPRALSQRGRSTMDVDRENFEKNQMTSLQKAINSQESPAKEKHVRRAIMGSHQDQGANLFWSIALRFPLQGNPIICWKFCQVLHKILRDGHPNSVAESYRYCGFLTDLGKLWGHLKDHHGRLIAYYTKLLVQKLSFHKKYPPIPGNLNLEDQQLEKISNNDINTYFEMSVDMLDYMDDILSLEAAVYGSLDMSRANSMTAVGQCRLSPLIPCIQDSCQLYDYIVKILFKLHSNCATMGLPQDTLGGHRDRFYKQYKSLKRFYFNSGNLQFFKNLIKVPTLPDDPPNFLVASELSSHIKPEAVVEEPEPEPEPEEAAIDLLVDTAQENGAYSEPMPDEKDIMIQQLMAEVTHLREEIARLTAEDQMMAESLHNRIRELEMEITELKQVAESTQEENESLRTFLKEGEKNQEAATRLEMMEHIAKTNEDKFKKIRDMYTRIKKEHVDLLRNHAEASKNLAKEIIDKEKVSEECKTLSQQLDEIQHEKSAVETTLTQSSAESAAELSSMKNAREQLEQERQLHLQIQSLETDLREITAQREQKQAENEDILQKQEQALKQIETLQSEFEALKSEKEGVSSTLQSEQSQHQEALSKIQSLEAALGDTTGEREEAKEACHKTQEQLDEALTKIQVLETEKEAAANMKQETDAALSGSQDAHQGALTRIQDLEKQLLAMTGSRDGSQRECEGLRGERDTAHSDIQRLEADLQGVTEVRDSLQTDLTQRTGQRDQALTDIKSLESRLSSTQDARQQKDTECEGLSQTLEEAKTTIQGLESSLSSETQQRRDTETRLADLQTTHQGALGDITSLEGRLSDTTRERDDSRAESRQRQVTIDEGRTRIQTLESSLEKTETDRVRVQTSLCDLQTKYSDTLGTVRQLTSDLADLKNTETTLNSDLQGLNKQKEEANTKNQELAAKLAALQAARDALQSSLDETKTSLNQSHEAVKQSQLDKELSEQKLREENQLYKKRMLLSAIEEGAAIIRDSMNEQDNPHISTITCTAEYLMDRVNPVLHSITQLRDSVASYEQNSEVEGLIRSIYDFCHRMGDSIVLGYATAQAAPIEEGEALSAECRDCGEGSLQLLETVQQGGAVPSEAEKVLALVQRILARAEALLPKVADVQAEEMGDLVDQEMAQTTAAIEAAAAKIASMLSASREKYTGIQLEVNEGILDSCNALMRAIMELVGKSKNLQREIVSQGRGATSAKEFYKKHHRWTEGLISAAKAVGWGANVLVEAADKAVRGEGKFEELMVCSQEIAASTAQLVVSSKVKAVRGSENLQALATASKAVTQCTGRVVASAKSGADAAEEIDAMDFSKLTLHQSKRMEMETQVKVLTLESQLEKERVRLSELRRTHYKLAGESEGWEQES